MFRGVFSFLGMFLGIFLGTGSLFRGRCEYAFSRVRYFFGVKLGGYFIARILVFIGFGCCSVSFV